MSDLKQVKVDNWGIYFLQRLKHFFNRTDYCDLTLQFQDNAQLKVHRLVLNACTEYFELLERTCEMYEDCLVMPDDLQADVVVPIVNFMYTGQLEFRMDSLERLYQTSLVMNMPVLSKLLEAHRSMHLKTSHNTSHNFTGMRKAIKSAEPAKLSKFSSSSSNSGKRSFNKAFETTKSFMGQKPHDNNKSLTLANNKSDNTKHKQVQNADKYKEKKYHFPTQSRILPMKKPGMPPNKHIYSPPLPSPGEIDVYSKKAILDDSRPTRYELPEELDTDNIFENSFTSISYTSAPLMVHPDTTKQYMHKKNNIFNEAASSKRSARSSSTVDIVECKKITRNNNKLFEDDVMDTTADDEMFQPALLSVKGASQKDSNQLFDQILDDKDSTKVTIESKDKQTDNLDHAKIISEVLKKYPHLVKNNKNIKLKILNTPTKTRKHRPMTPQMEEVEVKPKTELSYTYETDVLNSKEAAKLIAMGAENVKGPWICLICGTPGKALNFTSYHNFRKHLVDVHNEKPVSTTCEYCGLKSLKRNYLLHHIYTKHGIPPPPQFHFPKCNMCDYIALTEGFLVKHKLTHSDAKPIRCGVCSVAFSTSNQLFVHIHKTGHKVGADIKKNLQCIYCMKVFLRESNFYVHLKMNHRDRATRDGIIEDSDEEKQTERKSRSLSHEIIKPNIKYELAGFSNEYEETEQIQYQIQQRPDVNVHVNKKSRMSSQTTKHKILNPGFTPKAVPKASDINNDYAQDMHSSQTIGENIVIIDDNEYIMKDNQLFPRKPHKSDNNEYIISDYIESTDEPAKPQNTQPATLEFSNMQSTEPLHQSKMIVKKSATMNQPIQIVVSNEEEYKALMSSNHSIIFDDGDVNKTLTVLTAPHGTSLDNAAIDLENTESNDMMIIQDDYQINATEAVSGDSKFVVVYSHAMTHNDPNKQYQIITPQEIEAQFVQSTEVITQNYETVTTSAPHVIGAQLTESWQENMEQNIDNQQMQVGSETEIKTMASTDNIAINEIDNETNSNTMEELPEVHIGPEPMVTIIEDNSQSQIENNDTVIVTENVTDDNAEQVIIDEIQNNTIDTEKIVMPPETILEGKVPLEDSQVTYEQEENTTFSTSENNANIEHINLLQPQLVTETIAENTVKIIDTSENATKCNTVNPGEINADNINSNNIDTENDNITNGTDSINSNNIDTENDNITNGTTNQTITNINDNQEINTQEPADLVEILPICDENIIPLNENKIDLPIKVHEQVQNIASEWSEEEYEVTADVSTEVKESNENVLIENKTPVSEGSEIEETIENIEQEMQKQLASNITNDSISEENLNSFSATVTSVAPPQEPVVVTETTQAKLSSLLNDWDDNDSQEEKENESEECPNKPDAELLTNTVEEDKIEEQVINKPNPIADDNIKSLVSDWDDEEEEKKE